MKRRCWGLIPIIALLVVGGIAPAASAEKPEWSPAEKNAFTSSGGKAVIEQKAGTARIACEKSGGTGELINFKEGTFTELFEGCNAPLSGSCTGLTNSTLGSISLHSSWKLGYTDAAKTHVGLAFKLVEMHFECQKTIALVTLRGAVVASLTPINERSKTLNIKLAESKGVNELVEILNAANNAFEGSALESEINGGSSAQTGIETSLTFTFTKEISIVA
jgi:hypothetical protein